MNTILTRSLTQNDPTDITAFDYQYLALRQRQRPNPLRLIFIKLLAFTLGCVFSITIGLSSTSPQTQPYHPQNTTGSAGDNPRPTH